jgi:hypothetical protein
MPRVHEGRRDRMNHGTSQEIEMCPRKGPEYFFLFLVRNPAFLKSLPDSLEILSRNF